jgi:hypothetical protein
MKRKDVNNSRIPATAEMLATAETAASAETPIITWYKIQLGSQPLQGDKQLQVLQVLLTPPANLPPGLLILVANHLFIRIIATGVVNIAGKFTGQIYRWYQWHLWKIIATISVCVPLKVG